MANPRTIARLEARIHERAAYCLQFEVKDPRATFVTITKVELSTDLKHGKIYWSHYGAVSERRRAAGMLEHAAGFIQRQVARVLDTRNVPHLRWVYDESLEHADEIERLIREARQRDEEIRGSSPAPDAEHGEPASADEEE